MAAGLATPAQICGSVSLCWVSVPPLSEPENDAMPTAGSL